MNLDQFPLSMFEVDCDGSVCGSGPDFPNHVHPVQNENFEPICRVVVHGGERIRYKNIE